jgi:hypothetical protein
MATRQAVFAGMPELTIGLNSTEIIKICVTPPPKFPQPAAVALAVPTTFGENIKEHQNWLVTKVAPAGFVLRKIHSNRIFDNGLWVLEKLLFGSRLAAGGGGGWRPMGVDRWHAHPPNIGKEREQAISVSLAETSYTLCPWSVPHRGTMIFILNHGSFKYRLTQD